MRIQGDFWQNVGLHYQLEWNRSGSKQSENNYRNTSAVNRERDHRVSREATVHKQIHCQVNSSLRAYFQATQKKPASHMEGTVSTSI